MRVKKTKIRAGLRNSTVLQMFGSLPEASPTSDTIDRGYDLTDR